MLVALAAAVLIAALLRPDLGMVALVPFGLLLAFVSDAEAVESGRSVILSARNLGLVAVMVAAFGWFWLWHTDLPAWALVGIAATLIALPLALESRAVGQRTVVVTKRSVVLGLMGLVTFTYVYEDRGVWFFALAAVCVVLPPVLATSRAWGARSGRVELGLLRHPLRRELRPHLVQTLNIWLCCGLLGGVVAAGGAHYARIGFSLTVAHFDAVVAVFAGGLILLAALAVVPRRRVHVATNLVVVLLSGFLAVQLVAISDVPTHPVVLDSPLTGEWFVQNGGRSNLLSGHDPRESNAVDFQQMGANGRTHTGGRGAPLTDYTGFASPVLAPADGRVVEVTDSHPDNPVGTNGEEANHLVMDIGDDRYVAMAHLQQGSVTVQVGDAVRRGQSLAAVGNNGHSSAPHLHFQVQDSPVGSNADHTYPLLLRDVHHTRGGPWPWGVHGDLRTGDLVRAAQP